LPIWIITNRSIFTLSCAVWSSGYAFSGVFDEFNHLGRKANVICYCLAFDYFGNLYRDENVFPKMERVIQEENTQKRIAQKCRKRHRDYRKTFGCDVYKHRFF